MLRIHLMCDDTTASPRKMFGNGIEISREELPVLEKVLGLLGGLADHLKNVPPAESLGSYRLGTEDEIVT